MLDIKIVMDSVRKDPNGDTIYMGFLRVGSRSWYVLQRVPKGTIINGKRRPLYFVDSPRLGKKTLRVEHTPFLIHSGNIPEDSLGCYLPGTGASTWKVTGSRTAVAEIEALWDGEGWIERVLELG